MFYPMQAERKFSLLKKSLEEVHKTIFRPILQVRSACVKNSIKNVIKKEHFLWCWQHFLGEIVTLTTFLGAHKKRVHLWDWDPSLQAEA